MKNLNFLSNLCGLGRASQSSDVGYDCRLTVGSPSGLDAKWKQNPFMRFAVVLTIIFTIGSGNVWAGVRSGWTRVTSVSEITSGGTFIVGFESTANSNTIVPMINKPSTLTAVDGSGTSYLYSGTASTSNNTTINMSDNGSGATTSYEFEFVTGSSSGTISIKLSDNTYVGFYGSSNNNCKRYSSVSTNSSFTPTITTNDVVTLTNVQYTGRKLRYNNSSGSYRFSNYSTAGNVVLYKKASSCDKSVGVTKGSESHGEVTTIGSASVATCSATASDRRVTITIAPDDCYDAPSTLDWTKSSGTVSASKQSGPTDNGDGTYSYVYQFAQNDNGAGTFGVTCTAKAAGKTVNFDAGPGSCLTSSLTETCDGSGVILPAVTATGVCKGWTTFAGWATAAVSDSTTTSVTVYSAGSKYTPASNNMTLYAVYSKTKGGGSGFKLSLNSGGTDYYVGAKGSGSYMSAVTDAADAVVFTFANGYLSYDNSGTKTYISSEGNNTTLTVGTSVPSSTWTESGTTTYTYQSSATGNRYLGFNSGTSPVRFAPYGSSYAHAFTKHSLSTTYYCSDPNCCTELATINGSFSFSNVSATSVTVGVPSDYSDKDNANLEGYIFKRYAAASGGSALETIETNSPSGTTATFSTGLVANTQYYYTIIAKHSSSSCNSAETSPRKSHTITSYTVSYAAGDGSGTNPGAHNPVLSGTSVDLKDNTFTAPAGKEFAGWNDGTNDYDAGDSYTVTANKTMTAQWSCITPAISSSSISNASYSIGDTPADLSVTASGGTLSYEWKQCATENGTYVTVTGGTGGNTDTYTPPTSAASDLWYQCTVTNTGSSCNTTATSGKAHIIVSAPSYRLWTAWANGNDCDGDICNTWNWTGGSYFVNYNSTNEWRISNFTIPDFEWDAVNQRQMIYNVAGKNATNTKFYDLALAVSQGSASVKKGPMPGAVGTLRMYDNSDQPNGYLGFLPNSYMVRFGTHDYIMTETSSTVWETAIQTLDAADLTNVSQYRVGVTNLSDEFVAINENCPLTNVTTMGQKSNAGNNWGSNLAAGDAGKRGKFRIWLDNATNNWTCHFVPYHRIIFDANWPVGAIGDEPADTYSVDVSVEETNSSIALASAPTAPAGYTFDGWYTAADGGTKRTGSQTISAGATADVTLFAHWTANTNTAYTVRHYQQNIANDDYTLFATQNLEGTTGTSVTPATNNYTGFTAPSTVTRTILGDGSLVIDYQYTRNSYTLTWVLNGGTVTTAGTCAAVNATGSPSGSVKYGASLTAPVVTKTGYNMAWSSSPAATMPAANTTYTANWTLKTTTVSFNQNGGTGGQSSTKTATYSQAMPTPITTPTKAGYTFTGYYENSGGTGTKYYNADGSSATAWDKENSTWTLYAGWTAKEDTYKTALHTSAAGWTTYASGVTKSGAGYEIPAPSSVAKGATSTCEDTHYHFAGWVADEHKESPSGYIIAASGTTDATGTTYWAVWEKVAADGNHSIELDYSSFSLTTSYAEKTATVGGIGFKVNQGYKGASNCIQMNSSKGEGVLYNTTAISGLDSIKLYCTSAGATATIYQGSSEKPKSTSDPDERVGTAACAASTNYKIAFTGSGEYFTLKVGGATYFSKIEVYYSTYDDPKAECEACAATPSISGVSLSGSSVSLTSVPVQATGASAGSNCAIVSYGFCWGTSANPTGNSTASANLSDGAFSATLTGPFSVGQTYYYRAFATNEAPNTGYSSDGTFTLRSVTFNLNGHGSSTPSTQYVLNGGKASDPSYSESVTNWRFVGWYDEAACRDGHEWVFGTNTVSGANVTIYAKWLPDPTITFSVPTGVDAVASQRASVNLPTPTGFPSAVDDDCWAFAGWTESSSVNSTSKPATFYPAGTPYTGSQTSPFTLYAVYSRNKYLVVYDNDMLVADADYVITTWESDNYAVVGVADGNNAEVADMEDNFHDKVLRGLHYYTLDNPTENAVWHLTGTTGSYVLQNKATGKYLDLSSTSSPMISGSSATVAVTEGTGEDAQTYKVTGGDNHLVISSSGASVATGDATYYFLYKLLSSKYMTTPAEPTFTVTWKVAGEDDQTSTVSACAGIQASDISALTIPGDDHLEIKNGGCITNTKGKFMGWSTHDYGSASGKGSSDFSDLFKTYDKAPYLTDDITLYAVFAEAGGGGVPYYGLVEEDEDATEGTYLIVYNGTYAMGSHHDGNNANTYSDYSDISSYYDGENKRIASNGTTNALAYIAEETTNGYSLKHTETISSVATDVYLGCGKDDNKALRWDYPFTASTDEWLLAAGSVKSVAYTSRYIRWNNTSGQERFATYGSASCQDIQLYKYDLGYTYSNYRTSCCAKKVTIGTPTKTGTGTGTVTFESGGDAYAAGDEVTTCEGATTITVTITPTNGHQCTALEFTRSDEAALTPDPAISVPFTGAQSYDLTFEQNADGVTLNTTVTFVALIDHYIDNMHYNTTINKSGNYGTAPTLSDESKGEQCTGLHYKFIGWIPETDMNMTTGVPTTTANMVAGGATGKYATGTNYYAVWAEEVTP